VSRRKQLWELSPEEQHERFPALFPDRAIAAEQEQVYEAARSKFDARIRAARSNPPLTAEQKREAKMNDLDRLAKETRHARQDAEDALAVYLNRLKRNAEVEGASESDLRAKYAMDGQPRHLSDRQSRSNQ
jgi:hypothetical protein